MTFWIIIITLALVVSGLMTLALLRGRAGDEPPAAYDLRVYRDQLKEVDRDAARGVIAAEDADRARAEISRRILAADAQLKEGGDTGGQPRMGGLAMAGVTAVFLIGGALYLYNDMGAPGYADQGLNLRLELADKARRERPSQTEVEASLPPSPAFEDVSEEYIELMTKLRSAVAERPDDLQGQRLLARNEASLGNYVAAREAQEKVVELLGEAVTPADLTNLADIMVIAAGGFVSPEAESTLMRALALDPKNGVARYYMGLMFAQVGRPDATFRAWQSLIDEGPNDAPWIAPVRGQIEEVARLAGVDYTLPALDAAPGPDADQVRAAQEMTEEERNEMIRGMVAGLSDRLATEGGTPEEWARLISAYGVLGEMSRAQAIYEEAQQVFANVPEALQVIRSGAKNAGLLQ